MEDSLCFGLFGHEGPDHIDKFVHKTKAEVALNSTRCCVCDTTLLKYRCPGCGFRTCSFDCVKKHKVLFDCTGKRDKIPFVKLSEFSEEQFHDDFSFLEETGNAIDGTARERCKISMSAKELPAWLKKIQYEARVRGTRLKIMPAGFSKRKSNRTAFIYKEKAIHWDVEWILKSFNSDSSDLVIHDQRVAENTQVEEALNRHLTPTDAIAELDKTKLMKTYLSKGNLTVLLKTEDGLTKMNDLKCTLQEALVGKTVIEFPSFVLTHQPDDFTINEPKALYKNDEEIGETIEASKALPPPTPLPLSLLVSLVNDFYLYPPPPIPNATT